MTRGSPLIPGPEVFRAEGLCENALALPRIKPRSLVISLAYRLLRLGRSVWGREWLLRFCLNASWLLRRFAFELSGEVYGDSFSCTALALSEEVLRRWIPPYGSVIDIGCGTGRWCRIAALYAHRVVGIDRGVASIEAAQRLSQEGGILNVEYVVGDVTKLIDHLLPRRGRESPPRHPHFDVALLVHVLEHIDNVDSLLESVRGIAHTLIVEVPDFGADCLNFVRRKLGCWYYYDADHVREYTPAILRRQLERNGWSVRHEESHGGAILTVSVRA